jgi:hypothetical protein
MKKIIIPASVIAFLLIALSLSSFSSQALNNAVTSTPIPTVTSTPIADNEIETKLLRLEIELLKSHNQQLLDTIYWSIGTVFTLALFVVGAGWYVNFRLYEKDKIEIQRSLEVSLKERFEQDKVSLQNIAKKSGETAAADLRTQFTEMKRDMQYMQYDMLEEEAKSWHAQEVYSNELRAYFRMLEIAQKLFVPGGEWLRSRAIEGLQKSLESGAIPDVEDMREITKIIDTLDKSYAIEVIRIKDLLVAAKKDAG